MTISRAQPENTSALRRVLKFVPELSEPLSHGGLEQLGEVRVSDLKLRGAPSSHKAADLLC